jgi:uncharacterized protein (UPF0335 family)
MSTQDKGRSTADLVRDFVQRLENLAGEKAALAQDEKDVLEEAGSYGLSKKALKEVLRLRKLDKGEREALMTDVDLYMNALGMLADTPLGEAAVKRAQESGEVKPDKPKPQRPAEADVIDLKPLPGSTTKALSGPAKEGGNRLAPPTRALPGPRPAA